MGSPCLELGVAVESHEFALARLAPRLAVTRLSCGMLDAVVEFAEALHEEGHAELEHELAAFVSRWREGG